MTPNPGGMAGVALLFAVLGGMFLVRWLRERRRASERRAAHARWRAENPPRPPGPPATEEQRRLLEERLPGLSLPAVELVPSGDAAEAAGTRIGGPAWLAPGESWPAAADAAPMEFLAQIDFSALPPLPDFPGSGLLQFFVARSDVIGADFDDPVGSDVKLIWRPEALGEGELHPQPLMRAEESTPFEDLAIREAGAALLGVPAIKKPGGLDVPVELLLERLRIDERDSVEDILDDLWEEEEGVTQFVGGHPRFIQDDFRRIGFRDDYDRVLLQLDSTTGLLWGDVGRAVFMIRRDDLLARDFSRVAFTWDCS